MDQVCARPGEGHRSIAYGIGVMEELLSKIRDMNEKTKCFTLWNSLPYAMQDLLRHDRLTDDEYDNYKNLKRNCMNIRIYLTDIWRE